LGIRTAVNLQVALVKDEKTSDIPFDTGIINNHEYLSSLAPWTLKKEIKKLSDHLVDCFSKEDKSNNLWKYFGLSAKTEPLEESSSEVKKLDYLNMQISALRQELKEVRSPNRRPETIELIVEENLAKELQNILQNENIMIEGASYSPGEMELYLSNPISDKMEKYLKTIARCRGVALTIKIEKL
jgi:hypothetical protein